MRPATIIDAGANEGQFAVAVAKLFPEATVHSFEPDPDTFARLVRNVRAFPRVHPHLLALGDKRQQMPFYVDADTQVSSLLPASEKRYRAFPKTRTAKVLTVNVDTLSQFFATDELARPILLKLDVQGYEHLVLDGAGHLLPKIDYVLAETAVRPLYVGEVACQEMVGILADLGFGLELVADWHQSPADGSIVELDLFFSRASVPVQNP